MCAEMLYYNLLASWTAFDVNYQTESCAENESRKRRAVGYIYRRPIYNKIAKQLCGMAAVKREFTSRNSIN